MLSIDAVVVNYQTPDDLDRFLKSFETNVAHLWIVNVDPKAADLRVAEGYVRNHSDSVHLVHSDNCGYARAVNDAACRGTADVLAIFNADTELAEGLLSRCHDALMEIPDWGILGPRQVDRRGRLTHAGIFGTLSEPKIRAWLQPDSSEYQDVREAVSVSGSAYFVKRTVWDLLTDCPIYQRVAPGALGAFLPTPHYYEETFCSYHAQAHGFRVIYYGLACMIHEWHQSSPIGGAAERLLPESKKLFCEACNAHGIPHD